MSKYTIEHEYDPVVTGRKALTETGRVGAAGAVAVLITPMVITALNKVGIEADPTVVIGVVTALGAAVTKAFTNWYKNKNKK